MRVNNMWSYNGKVSVVGSLFSLSLFVLAAFYFYFAEINVIS
jgi:hypothetical protein